MEASPGYCVIIPYQLSIDLHNAECCVSAHTSSVPVTMKECKRTTDETIPRHGAHCVDRWWLFPGWKRDGIFKPMRVLYGRELEFLLNKKLEHFEISVPSVESFRNFISEKKNFLNSRQNFEVRKKFIRIIACVDRFVLKVSTFLNVIHKIQSFFKHLSLFIIFIYYIHWNFEAIRTFIIF